MTDPSQTYLPTSVQLAQMLDRAEEDRVSIEWLVEQLGRRSFGLTLLVMAVVGFVPGASAVVGLLMAWPAIQMVLGHAAAVLPPLGGRREIAVGPLAPSISPVAPRAARVGAPSPARRAPRLPT